MGDLVSLDEFRNRLSVKSIANRLLELGYEVGAVRKTIATLLVERGRWVTMPELWVMSLERLNEVSAQPCPKKEPERGRRRRGARVSLVMVKLSADEPRRR